MGASAATWIGRWLRSPRNTRAASGSSVIALPWMEGEGCRQRSHVGEVIEHPAGLRQQWRDRNLMRSLWVGIEQDDGAAVGFDRVAAVQPQQADDRIVGRRDPPLMALAVERGHGGLHRVHRRHELGQVDAGLLPVLRPRPHHVETSPEPILVAHRHHQPGGEAGGEQQMELEARAQLGLARHLGGQAFGVVALGKRDRRGDQPELSRTGPAATARGSPTTWRC